MDTKISLEHVEKYFGSKGHVVKALADVTFSVAPGEFVGVMGPSGSGKTTLLNCVATIDTVTGGHIWIDGTDITALKPRDYAAFRRSRLGFVFQDFSLLDTLTGFENIALSLSINGTGAHDIKQRVHEVAEKLGITDILNRYPYSMSGGEQQRVACARALVTQPSVILADEPTGALDSRSGRMLLDMFRRMQADFGATLLMVTHDTYCASHCDRVLFIKDGQLFNTLVRGEEPRAAFFARVMDVVSLLGGDIADAH